MANENSSDFAIISTLLFMQTATCFNCFLLLQIPLFNTVLV